MTPPGYKYRELLHGQSVELAKRLHKLSCEAEDTAGRLHSAYLRTQRGQELEASLKHEQQWLQTNLAYLAAITRGKRLAHVRDRAYRRAIRRLEALYGKHTWPPASTPGGKQP